MSERWRNWLNLITPRSGRIRCEDGRYVNQGDRYALESAYLSRLGRGYRAFWAGSVPASTTYDFVLQPPVGVQIYGISRSQTVLDGRLNIQFAVGGTYATTAGSPIAGFNYDELLEDTAQSQLLRVTDLTGASQRTSGGPIIAPATGPIRTSAAQTEAGFHPRFDNTRFPVFRYTNPDSAPVQLWIDLAWEEVDAVE